MDAPTNCEPWNVRRLASHALHNQLVWAGLVTGQQLVALEVAMGAEPIDGDLEPVAADVISSAMSLWRTDGVLDAVHVTPFGSLPGAAVIDFAIIDALPTPGTSRSASAAPSSSIQNTSLCSATSSRRRVPTLRASTA